ncbi:MAG: undecaprenyl-diphosphate phosphatase [Cyanobacteria bacterium SIG30]|nr:undecaprenyl-diphosphate phosphatase [Cyanobacteria bacterium SIG30]
MDTIQAIIMGFVQGLSEFLPISSSAHIVFASSIYKLLTGQNLSTGVEGEEVFFDILIHLATLLAILIFFRKDILDILKSFFGGLFNKEKRDQDFLTSIYIIIATFFTGIIALALKDITHSLIENPIIVSILLIGTGFVLLFSEKYKKGEKEIDKKIAIMIGIAQGLAVFPGLSRSGLTIATAVFNGINRTKAAKFSFLLSAPIILLASTIYPLMELNTQEIATFNIKAMILGTLVSFVTGYICIKYFMQFLSKHNLKCFAYYCFITGILMTTLFAFFKG